MIRRLFAWLRARRAARAATDARLYAAATVAAKLAGDTKAASQFLTQMHRAEAKRDALCCNHNCREGRDCPLRVARLSSTHLKGSP